MTNHEPDKIPPARPPVTPTPAAQIYWAVFATSAPFANPARQVSLLQGLSALLAARPLSVRFSNETGVVRSLRGPIFPAPPARTPDEMKEIAKAFIQQYGAVLTGWNENRWKEDRQATIGPTVRFRQTVRGKEQEPIPVYCGTASFGFDNDGQLTSIVNSWYPIPDEPFGERFLVSWGEAAQIARAAVGAQLRGDQRDSEIKPGEDSSDGKMILPWQDKEGNVGYRPVWVAVVLDHSAGRSWEVIVDAETGAVLGNPPGLATVGAIQAFVYLNNVAQGVQQTLGEAQENFVNLAQAPFFTFDTTAGLTLFAEPPQPPANVNPPDGGFRSANVYYHLRRALRTFQQVAGAAWANAPGQTVVMPGVAQPMIVKLLNSPGDGAYDPGTRTLSFGTGVPADPQRHKPPVGDTALDSDVIYHEYGHAVFHMVQPDLYNPNLPSTQFNAAMNEGAAFYLGCTVSERPHANQPGSVGATAHQWGELAFADQGWSSRRDLQPPDASAQAPGYDYLNIYGMFPRFNPPPSLDPSGNAYACGMLLARTLWDVRRVLGNAIADAIVLRGLNMAGGVQSELETLAEAIMHADGIYAPIGSPPPHENAVRLTFGSRGVLADAPIHDIITVTLRGAGGAPTTYVLTAIPSATQGGCMISADGGQQWNPLGTNMPPNVVALAVAKVSEQRAIVWAARGRWASPNSARLYRYVLEVGQTGNAWTPMAVNPDLPAAQEVLSLAAMKRPGAANDDCWVFAGTEDELYKFDGAWAVAPEAATLANINLMISPHVRVFDLTLVPDSTALPAAGQSQVLAVASSAGVYVFNPATMLRMPAYNRNRMVENVLTVVADPDGTGRVWAGTATTGIFQFDPAAAVPRWEAVPGLNRPVYDLLIVRGQAGEERYAATNDGIYRSLNGGAWNAFNAIANPNDEALARTTAVALGSASGAVLAATVQRGLWRSQANAVWSRMTSGLPRIGDWAEATASPGVWTQFFSRLQPGLPAQGVGTHIFSVPNDRNGPLSFRLDEGQVTLELYYAASAIDANRRAGLQSRTLQPAQIDMRPRWVMQPPANQGVREGFYLLVVRAGAQATSYQIAVTLAA